ncbi:MAG: hypothetical protein FWC10_00565 [Lentimicrobiaceae bacterium]|nr:hypothetical protein [Lentimicrobiaceae bacterium]
MKKVVILLIAAIALFSFSCNKYCNCDRYINGKLDKDYNKEYKGEFVKESSKKCSEFSREEYDADGVLYEVKCK